MPRVPYNPVPDVSPQASPAPMMREAVSGDQFGTNIGQAVQHLGSTFDKVGDELYNRAVAMQELRNETEATNSIADYEKKANDLHVQFTQQRGTNATDAYGPYRDSLDTLRNTTRDGLSNDASRRMFDRQALSIQNRLLFNGAGHAADETRRAASNAAASRIDSVVDTARFSIDDNQFKHNLDTIAAEVRSQGFINGEQADTVEQNVFKIQSRAWANRINELSKHDPFAAQNMFNDAVKDGHLHSSDWDRVENRVRTELYGAGARSIADRAMRDATDPEGFFRNRAGAGTRIIGMNPDFARRMQTAVMDYEKMSGEQVKIAGQGGVRTTQEQAEIYARHQLAPGGVLLHPAAPPGTSRHEFGEALDIATPGFYHWLRQTGTDGTTNADKYGLEFLKGETGKNDPGHIQLSRNLAPSRALSTGDISETRVEETARARARQEMPGDITFEDHAAADAVNLFRQQHRLDLDARSKNVNTILQALDGNSIQTVEGLRKTSPEVDEAWQLLDPKMQDYLRRHIASQRTVSDQAEVNRLNGMASYPDTTHDFLDIPPEDIASNPKLSQADRRKFSDLQIKIRAHAMGMDTRLTHAMGKDGIGPLIPPDTLKDKDAMATLYGVMGHEIDAYEKVYSKYPDHETLQRIGKRILLDQTQSAAPDSKVYSFGMPLSGGTFGPPFLRWIGRSSSSLLGMEVPEADRRRILNDPVWQKQGLPPPDENRIREAYIIEQYDKLYGKKK